jgi:hypothetical protein
MELLESYLLAVKPGLPRDQRDDILAELEENLRAQMEDKSTELGRPLTEAEQEEVLQGFGQPLVVAGRYQPREGSLTFGRQLIGPELFPFYFRTLKWVLGLAFVVNLSIRIPLGISNPNEWSGFFPELLWPAALQFAIVTGVWIGIQSYCTRNPLRWNINSLPRLVPERKDTVSRAESAFQLATMLVMMPWLQLWLGTPRFTSGPFHLASIWHAVYVPIMALQLVGIAQASVNLWKPELVRFRLITRLTCSGATVIVWGYLLTGQPWAYIRTPAGTPSANIMAVDQGIYYTFLSVILGVIIVSVGQIGFDLRKLWNKPTLPALLQLRS